MTFELSFVGNDVVDLGHPRTTGQASRERFLSRVFTPEEARWIRSAPDPDRTLWDLWAAKEAAFKVVSKGQGSPPVFEHRAFEAHAAGDGARVRWRDAIVPIRWFRSDSWVHAVGISPGQDGLDRIHAAVQELDSRLEAPQPGSSPDLRELLATRFTPREAEAIHSLPSARVRLAARAAAAALLGVEEDRMEVLCDPGPRGRTPPRLALDGGPAPLDVSLSHHGRFVAWALLDQRLENDGR